MSTTRGHYQDKTAAVLGLGLVAALIVASVLTNLNLAFSISDRAAFFALLLVGLSMCAMGKLAGGAEYGWFNLLHIVGYILGSVVLLLATAVLFNLPIPLIPNERAALAALAVVILVKLGVAALYPRRV